MYCANAKSNLGMLLSIINYTIHRLCLCKYIMYGQRKHVLIEWSDFVDVQAIYYHHILSSFIIMIQKLLSITVVPTIYSLLSIYWMLLLVHTLNITSVYLSSVISFTMTYQCITSICFIDIFCLDTHQTIRLINIISCINNRRINDIFS